jgi:hypothetical protein
VAAPTRRAPALRRGRATHRRTPRRPAPPRRQARRRSRPARGGRRMRATPVDAAANRAPTPAGPGATVNTASVAPAASDRSGHRSTAPAAGPGRSAAARPPASPPASVSSSTTWARQPVSGVKPSTTATTSSGQRPGRSWSRAPGARTSRAKRAAAARRCSTSSAGAKPAGSVTYSTPSPASPLDLGVVEAEPLAGRSAGCPGRAQGWGERGRASLPRKRSGLWGTTISPSSGCSTRRTAPALVQVRVLDQLGDRRTAATGSRAASSGRHDLVPGVRRGPRLDLGLQGGDVVVAPAVLLRNRSSSASSGRPIASHRPRQWRWVSTMSATWPSAVAYTL